MFSIDGYELRVQDAWPSVAAVRELATDPRILALLERLYRRPAIPMQTLNFGRAERAVPGPFDSGPLTVAAFEMSMDAPLPEAPMQLGDSWFVYQLISRTEADEEGFDEANQERLRSRLVAQKRVETLSAYIGRLRRQAEAESQVRINQEILSYGTQSDDEDDEESGDDEEESSSDETASR